MNVATRYTEIAGAREVGQRVRIHVLRPFREARMAEGVADRLISSTASAPLAFPPSRFVHHCHRETNLRRVPVEVAPKMGIADPETG